jgi:hypothetical protein
MNLIMSYVFVRQLPMGMGGMKSSGKTVYGKYGQVWNLLCGKIGSQQRYI